MKRGVESCIRLQDTLSCISLVSMKRGFSSEGKRMNNRSRIFGFGKTHIFFLEMLSACSIAFQMFSIYLLQSTGRWSRLNGAPLIVDAQNVPVEAHYGHI